MNCVGTFKHTWADAEGNVYAPAPRAVEAQTTIVLSGSLPIAEGAPAGTEIDLPFTGLCAGATHVAIQNLSGQELGMAWEGDFMPSLPPGGIVQWSFPSQVQQSGRSMLALRFFLTQEQTSYGQIAYVVGGA